MLHQVLQQSAAPLQQETAPVLCAHPAGLTLVLAFPHLPQLMHLACAGCKGQLERRGDRLGYYCMPAQHLLRKSSPGIQCCLPLSSIHACRRGISDEQVSTAACSSSSGSSSSSAPFPSQHGSNGVVSSEGTAELADIDWDDLGFGVEHIAPVRALLWPSMPLSPSFTKDAS